MKRIVQYGTAASTSTTSDGSPSYGKLIDALESFVGDNVKRYLSFDAPGSGQHIRIDVRYPENIANSNFGLKSDWFCANILENGAGHRPNAVRERESEFELSENEREGERKNNVVILY
jgi:hypothetical protein